MRKIVAFSLLTILGVVGQARASIVWDLNSQLSNPVLPFIGDTIHVTVTALPTGNGTGDPSLQIWALNPAIITGNAQISNVVALNGFSLLPPPNPGDLIGYSPFALTQPLPMPLFEFDFTRTGLGEISVLFQGIQGIPFQGNCADTFTGGSFTIPNVPSPGAVSLVCLGGLTLMFRRRW